MKYEHTIDGLIQKRLRNAVQPMHFTSIYSGVSRTFPHVSKTTVQRHLDKMADSEINLIVKSKANISGRRWHNETYYALSDKSKSEIKYFGDIQPIKSNREARKSKIGREKEENEFVLQNKIYLLLLLQGSRWLCKKLCTFIWKNRAWILFYA